MPDSTEGAFRLIMPVAQCGEAAGERPTDEWIDSLKRTDIVVSTFEFEPIDVAGPAISDLVNRILTADIDVMIFLTGYGTRGFFSAASRVVSSERLIHSVMDTKTLAGSTAADEALRELGIEATAQMAGTHLADWRDVLITVDRSLSVTRQEVAIERSPVRHRLRGGLESRGANVTEFSPFPLHRSQLQSKNLDRVEPVDKGTYEQWLGLLQQDSFDAILFSSASSAWRFMQWIRQSAGIDWRRVTRLLGDRLLFAEDTQTQELLQTHNLDCDWVGTSDLPSSLESIRNRKLKIQMTFSGPATAAGDTQAPWYNNPFMKACRGEPTDVTPIWMMRQAGRYMAEYREVRDKVSFLDLCANPQLCSEVMCTAVSRLGVDAAIIFSDLLPILVPMGCDLEFVKGDGPVIHNPLRDSRDIDRIKPLEDLDSLQFVMETVKQTRNDLPADMPLIGFAGAPFTLASYMIEGGASRNYANTKKLMFGDPQAWNELMNRLTSSITLYLQGQIESGAQCLQLFDSWAGCLSFDDYRTFVLPHVKKIIAAIPSSVPVINFATGNPALLPLLADTRASVIGIDWRVRLDEAWETVGLDRAVQGNLDPTVLLTNPSEIRRQAQQVLDQAAGRSGHIFNLGHGILPMTPVENAIALVDAVHELSQRG